jgi:hypothetical protein
MNERASCDGVRGRSTVIVATVAFVLVCSVLAGCANMTETISIRPLPVASHPEVCRGVGTDAVLAGGPFDPRVAWLKFPDKEVPLVWPPGWEARFAPDLEILNSDGKVVLKAGDQIADVCFKGPEENPPAVMMVGPIHLFDLTGS